jgi:hypothetical protein
MLMMMMMMMMMKGSLVKETLFSVDPVKIMVK